jgi:hypothetical protein
MLLMKLTLRPTRENGQVTIAAQKLGDDVRKVWSGCSAIFDIKAVF